MTPEATQAIIDIGVAQQKLRELREACDYRIVEMIGASVEVEVPKGHRIATKVGYDIPDKFLSIEAAYPTGRKRWKFWLPKSVYVYVQLVKKTASR